AQQLALDGRELAEAVWAPDGQRLYLRHGRGAEITTQNGDDVSLTGLALYDLRQGELYALFEPDSDNEGALALAVSPGGSTLAVWYAVCERVMNEMLPILELECTSRVRFIPVTNPANWTSASMADISRAPVIPILRWADWQTSTSQLPVAPTTAVSIPTASTLPAPHGQSPVPLGDVFQQDAYRYQITDVLRGTQATQFIRNGAVGSQVEPPAPGHEYMVVKLAVDHVEGDLIELGVSFFPILFGQNLSGQAHLFYMDGENGRERLRIANEGRVEAWLPFLIAADEPHPVLYLPPSYPRTAPIYLAVTADSPGLPATPPHTAVAANNGGLVAPAVNELISTRDWQIQINNVLRGDEIAGINWLAEALPNIYFEHAESDIVAANVTMIYQGDSSPTCVRPDLRVLAFGAQVRLRQELKPGFAQHNFTCYMSGGVHSGWVFMQSEPDNPLPTIKFMPAPTDPIGSRLLGLVAAGDAPEVLVGASNEQARRSQPTPRGNTAVDGNVRYTIVDTLRGSDALASARESWPNTPEPPTGYTYVLVKTNIENGNTYELETPPLGLTGSQGALYRPTSLFARPRLPSEVPAQSNAEGWRVFLVPAIEDNLVLVIPAPFDNDLRFSHFLALTEAGGPAATALPVPLAVNDVGTELATSAPLNTAVVTNHWQVRVLDSVRGSEALARLQAANSQNQPPAEGYEYVLALVEVTLTEGEPDLLYG
ncbi:MAG: hypothetical protein KDD89_10390, partial [Anaerolineales bacterium]|nr:hypothetical protein [Anaerolineales bacterium]